MLSPLDYPPARTDGAVIRRAQPVHFTVDLLRVTEGGYRLLHRSAYRIRANLPPSLLYSGLQLLHPDGTETLYAHLQYLYVRTGETVQAGQILGTAGQTGRATGAHLHFEFLTGGIRYDPSAALSLP